MSMQTQKRVFWAINRNTNRVMVLGDYFNCWELVQGCFRVGFMMPDGQSANGIGRCKSVAEFVRRVNNGGTTVLMDNEFPLPLQIEVNGSKTDVSPSIWAGWTGKRFIEGLEVKGERFYFLTHEPATK